MNGVYCLLIKVDKDTEMKVGALGNLKLENGQYIYVGSAQNGIERRVGRHFVYSL